MTLPARIGPYEVLGLLGKGGMGAVYRARHGELDAVRALKVLLRPDDATAAARFEREARALAAVRHPGVVGVHEVGVEADPRRGPGLLYLAMDLVEGESLEQRLRLGGRLEVQPALALVADAAEGVAALHAAGIVHRDLKPDNVVVRPNGRAVVIDLGLAQLADAERLTRTGAVAGTIGYLAPEQLEGKASPRTDVHALGLILHEALTGAPAILAGDSNQAVLARILSDSRPRPGALRPELPAAVDDLVAKATARDPAARFADAGELAAALRALAAAGTGPTVRQLRARRFALRAGALVLAGLGLALVVARALEPPPPSRSTPPPVTPAAASSSDPARGEDPEARRALERARRLDASQRGQALLTWLARWPSHPEAEHVRAAAREVLRRHPRWVLPHPRLAFAHFVAGEDDLLITVDRDGVLRTIRVGELAPRREVTLGAPHTAAALAPDGRLIVGTGKNELFTFDPELAHAEPVLFGRTRQTSRVAMSPDGEVLICAAGLGAAVCNPRDAVAMRHLLHEGVVVALAFEPGGLLLTGSGERFSGGFEGDNAVRGWEPRTGVERFRCEALTRCNAIVVLPGAGRRAVVGTNGGTLHVLDIERGELTGRLTRATARDSMLDGTQAMFMGIFALACTPDGRVVFAGSDDKDLTQVEVAAWSVETGAELHRLVGRPFTYKFAQMSRDGRTLLLGGHDALELWDVEAFTSTDR